VWLGNARSRQPGRLLSAILIAVAFTRPLQDLASMTSTGRLPFTPGSSLPFQDHSHPVDTRL
jgi:hypothetical protein